MNFGHIVANAVGHVANDYHGMRVEGIRMEVQLRNLAW